MKNIFTLFTFIFIVISSQEYYSQEEPSKAPDIKTFALNPDQIGALANSVNLFTGQVNLPINLISMKGRNGLDVNVSISYSSNVKNNVETWNLEAPTGVLGLGWQFGYSQIVVDHKGTGTREDDEFYLIEGGTSNKLVCYQINSNNRKYKTKNYQFWDITYYNNSSEERWEIVKENGIKYIYGGDLSSGRNTIQTSTKWGNWIGNSNNSTGASSIAVIWNLSKVQNVWGEEITFAYEVAEITLGASKQTEACYLKTITDNFNRQIEFFYRDKLPQEYQEQHTEAVEPDGYQERYEKKYIDSIVVKNANSLRLFSICFGYGNYGSGNLYKRQLTSIIQKNYYWESLPGLSFTYNSIYETNKAALKEVTLPTGSKIIYSYNSQQIEYSELNAVAQAPSGFAEPKVFIQDKYVVITWRNSSPEHSEDYKDVVVQIWEWDGKWNKVIEQNIGRVKLVNGYQDYSITFQDEFVGILSGTGRNIFDFREGKLSVFTKNPHLKGFWQYNQLSIMSNFSTSGEIVSGKDFIGAKVADLLTDYLSIYKKNGLNWVTMIDKQYIGGGVNRITANYNYLLLYMNSPDPDQIKIYRFDEDGNFFGSQNPFTLNGINSNNDPSYFYTNGYSFLLFAAGLPEYIYDWDESFSSLTQRTAIGPYPDYSSVFMIPNGYGIMKGDMFRSILCRKNGTNWLQSTEGLHKENAIAFGDDYYLWTEQGTTSDQDITLRQFNPSNSSFTDIQFPLSTYHVKKAGNNLFTLNEKLYNHLPNGIWSINSSTLYVPSGGIYNATIRHGNHFSVYESNSGIINTYFQPVVNNQVLTATTLNGQKVWNYGDNAYRPIDKSELVGVNAFVTFSASFSDNIFRDVTSLNLYKVINNKSNGLLSEYCVKGFTINDGYQNATTAIHYYPSYGVINSTGSIAQYNKVRVIPGGLSNYNPDVHNNGYTDTYFFNGLASNEVSVSFPIGTNTNAANNYMLLTGMPYETDVYDNNNVLKSSTKNYWYVYSKDVNTTKCYYTRLLQKDESLDGVTKTTENAYSENYGVLKSQQTKNYKANGLEEVLKTEYLYGVEVMPYLSLLQLQNRLTDVVQTKTLNGATSTGMSATTLKLFNGVWAPHKSYVRTAAGSTDFDFYNWSDTGEPPSDWLKTSEITNVDVRGQVVETKDTDGRFTTTHWDRNGLQVASFSNTQNTNKTISENFDDLSFTDGQPASWTGTGGWAINSLGVLSWPTNTESTTPFYSTLQTSTNFIAEFDVRIPSASTTSDWGGFQFRKTAASDGPFTSGLTVFLRKNGRVDLYGASGTTYGYYLLSGTDVASDWQRIRVVANGTIVQVYINGIRRINATNVSGYTGIYTGFYAYRSQAQFDNLIIYPDDAYASMTGYDPKFLLPLKNIDAKGAVVKNVFDSFQKKIGTVGPTNIPISTVQTFLSTDRYGSFNVTDPNSSLSTTVHGNFGLYNDFSTHINNWTLLDNSNGSSSTWTLTDGKLAHTNSGDAINQYCDFLYLDLGTNLTGRIGVEFSVKTDPNCDDINFGFGLGGSTWTINTSSETNSAVWTRFSNGATWQIKDGGNWITAANWLKPKRYYRLKVVIDVTNKKVDYFIDGKPLLNDKNFVNASNINIRKFAFFNYGNMTSTTWYIDDLMIYTEPSHSIVFTDAIGKALQTQTEETSSSIICSETLYDVLGRGYVQTMPVRLTSSWLGYNSGFVTSFDDGTGAIAGTVLTGSVDNYPYSRTVYELSPLSRAIEQGQPGNELRIGNGHTIQNVFTTNSSGQFPINYPTGQGFVTRSTNADGVRAWELKDKLGRTLASQSGPVIGSSIIDFYIGISEYQTTDLFTPNISGTASYSFYNPNGTKSFSVGTSPGASNILFCDATGSGSFNISAGTTYYLTISGFLESIQSLPSDGESIQSLYSYANVTYKSFVTDVNIYPVTTNEYDTYGNLVKIYHPNYYNIPDPSFDKNKYIINMTYDFNGRLKTKQSSDYDTVRYVYDKAGRLRFSMDGNGESQTTDNIKYIKYDGLGRVSEEGYIVQNWNESTLQNYANTNPSWPTTPATWRKKYTYGSHGSDVFQRGEVTQVQVNNDANSTAEVTETYTYNILGDVTTVSTTANGINQAISYTYNYDGQVATINYGTTTVYYGYDRLGRASTIGTSSDADYYASYSYANYNGSLYQEKLNNNSILRQFTYNNHGWLSVIDDDNTYFKETILYHSGGYGDAGYYNGNISRITVSDPEQGAGYDYTMALKYDNLGRMQVADVTDGMGANLNNYDIGVGTGNETKLDANGNLLFVKEGTANRNYKYFANTNLLKNTDGSTGIVYSHDKNGNIISAPYPHQSGITYDPYFNLTTGLSFEDMESKYWYGADNERVLKRNLIDPVTSNYDNIYYYRGLNDYPLVEKKYNNSTLQSTKLYIYGPTGLVAIKDGSQNFFVIKDHLGSTRAVVNSNGSKLAKYHYSPYGKMMYAWVNTDVTYKFTGQERDDEFGLYNFRARLYDAELGMFYAYDPASQGFSPFGYCGNNPLIRVDKNGKFFLELAMIISAATTAFESIVAHGTDIHNGFEFLGYAGTGAGVGAASAYFGYAIGTSGIIFSNTLGLMTSSFVNSAGMSAIMGENLLNINFGIGNFNFSTHKFEWAFNKNTHGFEWVTDVFNTVNFANDVYAAAFVDFTNQETRETGVKKLAEENDNNIELADRFSNKPISNLKETWKPVGKDISFSELAHQKFGPNNPPLGKWIPGIGERFGRFHVGNFLIEVAPGEIQLQTFIHSDVFNINKNLLWHAFEWIVGPSRPKGDWHP